MPTRNFLALLFTVSIFTLHFVSSIKIQERSQINEKPQNIEIINNTLGFENVSVSRRFLNEESSSFVWRDLTESELKAWYSPTDLCLLELESFTVFPSDLRKHNCTKFSGGSRRQWCGVGMGSNNHDCYSPFGTGRPSFKRGVVGFTDVSSKPMIQAMYQLIASHSVLVFLGDSTMRQKLQALHCELSREDHRIKINGNLWGIVPCDTTLDISFPDGLQTKVYAISMGPKGAECLMKPEYGGKSKNEVESLPGKGVFMHADNVIRRINDNLNMSVTVVANMGLWYNDKDSFAEVIPATIQWLRDIKERRQNNLAAWHETMSQHWFGGPDKSGYFYKPDVLKQEAEWKPSFFEPMKIKDFVVPTCCSAILNSSRKADWRNHIVREAIKATDGKGNVQIDIPILAMADITRDIPDLHTCNPHFKHDCTHYCFTPLLFQPLWHQIRDLTNALNYKQGTDK